MGAAQPPPAATIAVVGNRSVEARCWLASEKHSQQRPRSILGLRTGPGQSPRDDVVDAFQLLVRRHRHYLQVLLPGDI